MAARSPGYRLQSSVPIPHPFSFLPPLFMLIGSATANPTYSPVVRRRSGSTPLATCEEAVDRQEDDRPDHATNEACRFSSLIPPDSLAKVSCNERAYYSQNGR